MKARYRSGTELNKFKALAEEETILVLDLETSGLSAKKDAIIEICAIECRFNKEGQESLGKKFKTYINPGFHISKKITDLTGITNNLLEEQPSFRSVFPHLVNFLGDRPICAYNSKFDYSFLKEHLAQYGYDYRPREIVDALEVVRDAYEFQGGRGSYRLEAVAKELRLNISADKLHGAEYDVLTTIAVLYRVLEKFEELGTKEGDIEAQVLSIVYWEGYKGWSRIYVNTSAGTVYYCPRSKSWYGKDVDTGLLDMGSIIRQVVHHVGYSPNNLGRFKGKIYL